MTERDPGDHRRPSGRHSTLDFDQAAAIDLAGRDVLDAVRTSVMPKIIDCPDPRSGKAMLSAVASNGIELLVKARVTVRTNLAQLIGGATEETIIARVGQGIVTSIGSVEEPRGSAGESRTRFREALLDRGLDAQTAFEIVSIDIAQVQVGQNIGARLQADAAEADTRVARAKAEQRRAEAIALEQEMKAKVAENRSRLVEAEAAGADGDGRGLPQGHISTAAAAARAATASREGSTLGRDACQ